MSGTIQGKAAAAGAGAGAGSGLGRTTAHRLARDGARIVCADLEGADDTARAIIAVQGRAVGVQVDVSRPEGTERMVQVALDQSERINRRSPPRRPL